MALSNAGSGGRARARFAATHAALRCAEAGGDADGAEEEHAAAAAGARRSKAAAARPMFFFNAKFSILAPGTHILPHCGPSNARLRAHVTLRAPRGGGAAIRVGGETRAWRDGDALVLDDSFEHEVWHNGTEPRAVLILDLWHPQLPPDEKSFAKYAVAG